MPGNINDLLTKVNNGALAEPAQLAANKETSDDTATLSLTTGWPDDTAIHFAIFKTDTDGQVTQGSVTYWKATRSGTTLSDMQLKGGTNQAYATGDPILLLPSPYWANDVVDWGLEEHNQDGTHGDVTANSVSTDAINEKTSANGVTIDGLSIKDGKLNTNNSVLSSNLGLASTFTGGVQTLANAGTAGGNIYYIDLGGLKMCWGTTLSRTSGPNSSTQYTITLPASFFSSIQHTSYIIQQAAGSATNNDVTGISATTSTLTFAVANTTASPGVGGVVSFMAIGT